MSQSMVMLIGRVLMGILFVVPGIRKAMSISATVAYMAKGGVPMADVMVYGAIALEVLGGLALIIGWKTKAIAWILTVFLVVITLIFHSFWTFPADQVNGQLTHFLKNLAIIGGMLYIATFGAGASSADKA